MHTRSKVPQRQVKEEKTREKEKDEKEEENARRRRTYNTRAPQEKT